MADTKILKVIFLFFLVISLSSSVRAEIVKQQYVDNLNDVQYFNYGQNETEGLTPTDNQRNDFRLVDIMSTGIIFDTVTKEIEITLAFGSNLQEDLTNISEFIHSIDYTVSLFYEYSCFLTECDRNSLYFGLIIFNNSIHSFYSNPQIEIVNQPLDYLLDQNLITFRQTIDDESSINIITRDNGDRFTYRFYSAVNYDDLTHEFVSDELNIEYEPVLGFHTSFTLNFINLSYITFMVLFISKNKIIN